jgi:hypothetical protein
MSGGKGPTSNLNKKLKAHVGRVYVLTRGNKWEIIKRCKFN